MDYLTLLTKTGSNGTTVIIFYVVILVAFFYFMIIRPQEAECSAGRTDEGH